MYLSSTTRMYSFARFDNILMVSLRDNLLLIYIMVDSRLGRTREDIASVLGVYALTGGN